jgi:hypothetical protein
LNLTDSTLQLSFNATNQIHFHSATKHQVIHNKNNNFIKKHANHKQY